MFYTHKVLLDEEKSNPKGIWCNPNAYKSVLCSSYMQLEEAVSCHRNNSTGGIKETTIYDVFMILYISFQKYFRSSILSLYCSQFYRFSVLDNRLKELFHLSEMRK